MEKVKEERLPLFGTMYGFGKRNCLFEAILANRIQYWENNPPEQRDSIIDIAVAEAEKILEVENRINLSIANDEARNEIRNSIKELRGLIERRRLKKRQVKTIAGICIGILTLSLLSLYLVKILIYG